MNFNWYHFWVTLSLATGLLGIVIFTATWCATEDPRWAIGLIPCIIAVAIGAALVPA